MRRNEITSELIELSKRAKELGFPQDVEEGDFVCYINAYGNRETSVVTKVISSKTFWLGDGSYLLEEDNWFLILSFSCCLEWLKKEGYLYLDAFLDDGIHWHLFSGQIEYDRTIKKDSFGKAKTHHEAIAKAVVKILEDK